MKRFELPEMEINRFSVVDVITVSGGGGTDPTVTKTLTSGKGGAAGSGIISDTAATYYNINFEAIDMAS